MINIFNSSKFFVILGLVVGLTACSTTPVIPTENTGKTTNITITPTVQNTEIVAAIPVSTTTQTIPTFLPTLTPIPFINPIQRDFKIDLEKPVLATGPTNSWDSGYIDAGGVVYNNGKFHMIYNGVQSFPAEFAAGYAVSLDGMNFSPVLNKPVFTLKDIPWEPKPLNFRVNSLMFEKGTWVVYFTASYYLGSLTGNIGRATASSPSGPWNVDPEPILAPGQIGEWDQDRIGHVDVLPFENGYVMYYSCMEGVGMATSTDGIKWSKFNDPATTENSLINSDPVIKKSTVEDPNIQHTSRGWIMTYLYKNGIYYAVSNDGIHWTETTEPIVTPGMFLHHASLLIQQGRAYLYFEAGKIKTNIYLATWLED